MRVTQILIFAVLIILSCNLENEKSVISKVGNESVNTLERAKYRLQYPSTWRIDTIEEGYDLDNRFSLYPPYKNAVCMFFLLDAVLDEEKFMNDQVNAQLEKTIKNGKVTYFERWGSLKGHGANITGRFLGVVKGKFSVFCRSTDSSTFMVVHQYPDRIENRILPELQKIKSTFKLKK